MNCYAQSNPASRGLISAACAAVIAFTFAAALPAHAAKVTPPDVPGNLKVLDGTHAYLVGHAVGTQNYVCSPSATTNAGVAYVLFTPEATLLNDDGDQLITHYFSPNPDLRDGNTNPAVVADGAIRATWQHSRDGSTIWAKMHPNGSADVNSDAVAWVLLDVVGNQPGFTGGDFLTNTTQVQRLNTAGGKPPKQGCDSASDLGHQAFSRYTADYFFYTAD